MTISFRKRRNIALIGAFLVVFSARISAEQNGALRTKEFAVMGYEGILFELRSGEGPYLKTLIELLNVDSDRRAKTIEQVRGLTKAYPNIMDFAEQVCLLQQGAQSAAAKNAPPATIPSGPGVYSGAALENALTHLTKGMQVTVFTKGGAQFSGWFEEYAIRRLWMKGAEKKSFLFDDILAVKTPGL